MPLTPFHFGPALFVGLLLLSYIDLPTFLVANVIVDFEPILVVTLGLGYPLHGFFHSFVGGTIVAFALAVTMGKVRRRSMPILSIFRREQKASVRSILLASFFGVYFHILLDSNMHGDIRPFYPLTVNPFLDRSALSGLWLHLFLFWSFVGAVVVYALRLFLVWRRQRQVSLSVGQS